MTDTRAHKGAGERVQSGNPAEGPGRAVTARPSVVVFLAVVAFLVAVAAVVAVRQLGDDGDRHTLVLAASELEYSSSVLEGRSGEVAVAFANTDAVTHTFTIPALGVDLVVGAGEAATATFRAGPGTYRFVCTVPGHDGPGMRGELRLR